MKSLDTRIVVTLVLLATGQFGSVTSRDVEAAQLVDAGSRAGRPERLARAQAPGRRSCGIRSGGWQGFTGYRILDEWRIVSVYRFELRQDRSYAFTFGDEHNVLRSHSGMWDVAAATDPGSRKYPCLVRFQPDASTIRRSASGSVSSEPRGFVALSDGETVIFRFRNDSDGDLNLIHGSVTGHDLEQEYASFSLSPDRGGR